GDVSGTRGIVKEDWRTLVLQGTNTYSGDTTINKGTIALEGSATLDSPNILLTYTNPSVITDNSKFNVTGLTAGYFTLADGQKVKGVGSVVGNLVAAAGSILEPGMSVGTLYIWDGDLTLQDGALLNFELNDPTDPSTSDQIVLGVLNEANPGALILGGQEFADFTFTELDNFGEGVYTLIDAGSVSGSLGSSVNGAMGGGLVGTLSVAGDDLILTVAVPEPAAFILLLGLVVPLLAQRRR
ncbi:MAG: autotransporter-associated beta strand repeat-containing protein, partial [Pirellulales bacterium]|nr:autotransporter-associated beta strand repeat-containing protein [Pirellulales bacterium]